MPMDATPRVLIIAEHASFTFGGEASLPLHYFLGLQAQGVFVQLVTHSRTRTELGHLLQGRLHDVHFIEDGRFDWIMWQLGKLFPDRFSYHSFGFLSRLNTQIKARRMGRQIIKNQHITVVHQPIPVSPREPSLLFAMGAPVVIGPMNGNMSYPPQMQRHRHGSLISQVLIQLGRSAARLANILLPGKLRAEVLLIANERTRQGLPAGSSGTVMTLVENAIDPAVWCDPVKPAKDQAALRLAFVGRLIHLKRVDLVLRALAHPAAAAVRFDIIGDGSERAVLDQLSRDLGLSDRVTFHGWLPQTDCAARLSACDCLILPSLRECGGAVVLEAMAAGLPVIATDWGGPADYLTDQCGFLITPDSEHSMVDQIVAALDALQKNPDLGPQMGSAGKARALEQFTWPAKIAEITAIYRLAQRRFHQG